MSYLNDLRTGELWARMKSYINNKLSVVDDKILHAGYSRQTLLWTNPAPTSAFAAQTVALNLSDYDFVEIYARHSTSHKYITFKIAVGDAGILTATNDNSSLTNLGYFRNATVRASGVEFGSGYFNNASNDSALVPYKIYGIKNGIPVSEADDALLSLKGVSKMIKLWENASPTSNFGEQSIDVNYIEYDLIAIYAKPLKIIDRYICAITKSNSTGIILSETYVDKTSGICNRSRAATFSTNSINFALAQAKVGTQYSDITDTMIPVEIYGIKEVQ